MIQQFPDFTNLSIDDKPMIEKLIAGFEPYSDFNFTSLFAWDDGSTEVAILHNNLIIKMTDYMVESPLYSILGDTKIDESLARILQLTDEVRLVPAAVTESILDRAMFTIAEDRDQFDYVYSLKSQVELTGGHFKVKRNKINKFMNLYDGRFSLRKIDFKNEPDRQEIKRLFQRWSITRDRERDEVEREGKAIERLLNYSDRFNLSGIELIVDEIGIGFSINEIVDERYAICHFQKSILEFENADVFLSSIVSKELIHFGCQYVNWEQDLGIPGLRALKQSYNPEIFLKKYTITRNDNQPA